MISMFFAIFLGLIGSTGIAINGYILFVITLAKQIGTVNGMLLVQTSAVELLLSVWLLACNLPHQWRIQEHEQTFVPSGYCSVCTFLFAFLRPVALWTVCGLHCDRYYAISAPLHYSSLVNPKKVMTGMFVIWMCSLLVSLPSITLAPQTPHMAPVGCGGIIFSRAYLAVWYTIMYTMLAFIAPFVLILVCNYKVLTIARHHKHRIASAIFEVTLSAQVTITHQKNPFRPSASSLANRFKGRSASMTVFQLLGSFFLIYVPYYAAILWDSTSYILTPPHRVPSYLLTIASTLLCCSSPINGLLYGVKSKALKKSFQNYWRKQMTKNELNQEIQARTPSTCGSRRPSVTPAAGFVKSLQRRPSESSFCNPLISATYPALQFLNLSASKHTSGSSPGLTSFPSSQYNDLKRTHSFRSAHQLKNNIDNRCKVNDGTMVGGTKWIYQSSSATPDSSSKILWQRFQKGQDHHTPIIRRSRSPKIMITRAYSEEKEATTDKTTLPKSSSSVTTLLLGNNWKNECLQLSTEEGEDEKRHQDWSSEESQEENEMVERRSNSLISGTDRMYQSAEGSAIHDATAKSWPFTKRKAIQFRIGSVILSRHNFASKSINL